MSFSDVFKDWSLTEDSSDTKAAGKLLFGKDDANRKKIFKWYDGLTDEKKIAIQVPAAIVVQSGYTPSRSLKVIGNIKEIRDLKYGLRLYVVVKNGVGIVLVAGDKSTQDRDIALAKEMANAFND